MHSLLRVAAPVLVASAAGLACAGDDTAGPSGNLVSLPFSDVEHQCQVPILTVTAVLGPRGAGVTNPLPGRYVARGTFDFTPFGGPAGQNYVITLGFLGTYVTASGGQVGEDRDQIIGPTQTTGNFEVAQEILEWEAGPGNPIIDMFPGTTPAGSAVDCVMVLP
jgi:hypothetical protein